VTFQSLRSSTVISPSGKLSKGSSERVHFGFAALHRGELLRSSELRVVSCLLLDLVMPGTNGLEVTQELGARGLRIPTVFVTAHAEDELEQHLVAAGRSRSSRNLWTMRCYAAWCKRWWTSGDTSDSAQHT
jgi:CheY-like chemotaxis protein